MNREDRAKLLLPDESDDEQRKHLKSYITLLREAHRYAMGAQSIYPDDRLTQAIVDLIETEGAAMERLMHLNRTQGPPDDITDTEFAAHEYPKTGDPKEVDDEEGD